MQLPFHLSRRQARIAKIAGFVFLAIATFLITLQLTFPYDRVKSKLEEVLGDKYDVSIASVGPGLLPGKAVFKKIVLRSRPSKPGEKPTEIVIDRLDVDLGLDYNLFALIRKKVVVDIEATIGGGTITGEVDAGKSMVVANVSSKGLSLGDLPGVSDAVGLPMTGQLDADIEIRLPAGKWQNADGKIAVDCVNCTVGDGVARLELNPRKRNRGRRLVEAAQAWGKSGVTVPRLALGEASARIDISKGIGKISKFNARSNDGWFDITGQIEFRDPFSNTLFPGCMKFKLDDALKAREPTFGNIEFSLSEKTRQADGSFAIPTKGKLTALRWDLKRQCGGGVLDDDDDDGNDGPPVLAAPTEPEPDEQDDDQPATGGVEVDPASLPGVSMDTAEAGSGEVPSPGSSGPALGATPPGLSGLRDGGTQFRLRNGDRGDDDDRDDNREDDRDRGDDGRRSDDGDFRDDEEDDRDSDRDDPRDRVVD